MDFKALDLSEIKGYSAFILAERAGVNSPSSRDSYGARMLTELRDETVQAWEEGRFEHDSNRDDFDVCAELAGETLTSESHPVFSAWVDVCAWSHGWPDVYESSPGEWTFTGTIEDMVRASLDDILTGFSMALVTEIRSVLEAWQCPDCGDAGYPRVCWPGQGCEGDHACDEEGCLHEDSTPGCAYSPEDSIEPEVQADQAQATDSPAQAVSVEAEPVSDPILDLMAKEAGDTHAFSSYAARMSATNVAEFGQRKRRIKWVRVGLAVTLAVVGLVLVGIGVAGAL